MPRCSRLSVVFAAALLGCGERGAWQRVDLTQLAPQVLQRGRWVKPFHTALGFLGEAEVRDLSLVPPDQLLQFPQRTSGQVRVLEQAAGSRLAWRLDLGDEPVFTATPVGGDARLRYHVLVRDSTGAETELFRQPARAPGPSAPAAIEIALSAWRDQRIELILAVTAAGKRPAGGGAPRATWGSPEVWSRVPPAATPSGPPNVLVLGMDTLRADALGPRAGGQPSLTPALDALAAHSDVWSAAYSTFNVTNPSFASIFTGLYGKNHGVYDLATPLPAGFTTLAESYAAAGYRTLAVIAASHLGDHNSGLGQGFERTVLASHHSAAELAVAEAMAWIASDEPRARRPFFAWVHLFDPHTPHTPPQPYASGLRPAAPPGIAPIARWLPFRVPGPRPFLQPVLAGHHELYLGEVAYLDRQVGRLLEFLESRGLLENTVIAVVADHGENLGEHGIHYQHIGLFETTTHVPLMIRWPGRQPAGRRFSGLVQTLDLFPTLLAATGLPVPEQDGVDLRELTRAGRAGRRLVFSEHFARHGARVRTAGHSLMTATGIPAIADGEWLFDLAADPAETRNLSGGGGPAEAELRRALGAWLQARRGNAEPAPGRELNAEEIAKLRALGYF